MFQQVICQFSCGESVPKVCFLKLPKEPGLRWSLDDALVVDKLCRLSVETVGVSFSDNSGGCLNTFVPEEDSFSFDLISRVISSVLSMAATTTLLHDLVTMDEFKSFPSSSRWLSIISNYTTRSIVGACSCRVSRHEAHISSEPMTIVACLCFSHSVVVQEGR